MNIEKANRRMSLTELKQFIKAHNLNKIYKPDLLLTQSKGNLIKGLIKHGFLEEPKEPLMVRFKIENKKCRFNNCNHVDEPNCVVKENLGKSINIRRYNNYISILSELI